MHPTPRGIALVAVSVALLAAGWWLELAALRVLGGAGSALAVLAVVQVVAPLRLQLSRELERGEVTRGEPTLVRLRLRSTSRLWSPGAHAAELVTGGGLVQRQPLRLPALRPGGSASRSYELRLRRRGRYLVGPLAAQRDDVLGLARRRGTAGGATPLLVLPRVHRARALPVPRTRGYQGVAVDGPARGAMEFRSLREYVVGDEPRHVHWKSSARTGQLMVKELMDPQEPRLVVVLDVRSGAMSEDAFEEAVEVCASLVRASTAAGHPTRLRCGGGPGSASELDTATGADGRDFVERLAMVGQDGDPREPLVPADLLALEGVGTSLALVTGAAPVTGSAEAAAQAGAPEGEPAGERGGGRGGSGSGPAGAGGAAAAIDPEDGRQLAAVQAQRGLLDRAVVVRLRPGAPVVGAVGGISLIEESDARGAVARWNAVMGR